MGDKLAENLLEAIEESRKPRLTNLIYALGIRNVGFHLAGVLSKRFTSIDNLAKQGIDEFIQVHEVGPVVAESIYNFFHNPKNLQVLDKLKKGGVVFPVEEVAEKEFPLKGMTFVLTGGMDSFTREEARSMIEILGGRVTSSVSRNTDYVVVGKDPGSKYDNALKMGIKTLREDEFKKMVGGRP
jgi:DNA ligase (NAD+)